MAEPPGEHTPRGPTGRHWRSAGLAVAAAVVTLLLLEAALRTALKPSRIYRSFNTVPALNQWHNEVTFWETYGRGSGGAASDFESYDPILGWDHDLHGDRVRGDRIRGDRIRGDRIRGDHIRGDHIRGEGATTTSDGPAKRRILALGDSFVFGTDVGPGENFPAVLDTMDSGSEVLNMAVPGYGIDQAVLKYIHFGAAFRPDAVVLGVYVSDYERSSMAFTYFSKPRFRARGDQFAVENQPVPHPTLELQRIARTLHGRSHLAGLATSAWRRVTTGADAQRAFFDNMDPVVSHILTQLQNHMGSDQQLLIVHIPPGEAFVAPDDFRAEMSTRLLRIYDNLKLRTIDLHTAFLKRATAEEVFRSYYVHKSSGSVGHLSRAGHQRVAELVHAELTLAERDVTAGRAAR